MEDRTISASSVQGQFTTRYCNPAALDAVLAPALRDVPSESIPQERKPYGKTQVYAFGTVARIELPAAKAFFLALAELNEYRTASSSTSHVLDSLPKLWAFIRSRGDLDTLVCPILGSGYARVQATREELAREIVRSFVAAAQEGRFCEKLVLALHPPDVREGRVSLAALAEFTTYVCRYSTPPSETSVGTPVGVPAE